IKTAVRENIFSSLGVRQAGESFRLSQLNELTPTLIFSLADPRRDLTKGDCSANISSLASLFYSIAQRMVHWSSRKVTTSSKMSLLGDKAEANLCSVRNSTGNYTRNHGLLRP